MRIKNHFHVNSLTLSLALKQRLGATQKWPIEVARRGGVSYFPYILLKEIQIMFSQLAEAIIKGLASGFVS